ncbi:MULTISPECIES: cytochrome c oxidase assembly protein [Halomonadaceae]|uniref:cytochrome c oxidase assembly protein n=1 Tax=Halomonadaceae TaxID=28256 RepID=UPI001EE639F0|nr:MULTISPECIES: cytochrome c oxidase assembly protein [Halomonas]WKV95214.1 cytochrome c oxidase assembly protein [Halomonas sp. HAL1]
MLAIVLYLRGLRQCQRLGEPTSIARTFTYLLGVAAIYGVTLTHYDYLAQYMFFAHRAQHLVLHHAAPFLIALAAPLPVLVEGLPTRIRQLSRGRLVTRVLHPAYRILQQPLIAPVLFVGLIYFWLIPEIHFDAMLSADLYQVMNWSMALDGLLFWWLIFDHRSPLQGGLGYGKRIAILLAVIPPQIVLGAYIAFSEEVIFDVYEVCGRAWPLDPLDDQRIGGLLTWVPATMMSALGVLIVLSYMFRDARNEDTVHAPHPTR